MVGTAAHDELMGELAGMLALLNKGGVVITRATDFNADLNVDSVAVMDFVLEVEDTYDITIPINLLSEVTTVGDFADVVARARANN
ncbi:acyl carrier protein [Alphaproteobacteria bacterium]|jgi:acyl carrier protein|nr:acyl carrier protein [Alphaproteobacteria bacterium]